MSDSERCRLLVCTHRRMGGAGSCGAAGGEALADALRRELAACDVAWAVEETGCLGYCIHGPNLKAAPGGPVLHRCDAVATRALIDRLLEEWTGGACVRQEPTLKAN